MTRYPIPPAVLDVLADGRPKQVRERISRTGTALRISGGWSCSWSSADGLAVALQLVDDEQITTALACICCGGGPVLPSGCRECGEGPS